MRETYRKQVALLMDVLPLVTECEVFALKGGTAINYFFADCPRLSVDIDLHYLPINDRDSALRDIETHMLSIKAKIEGSLPDVRMTIDKNLNALVESPEAMIKIEPNSVIRGNLLPPLVRELHQKMQEEFSRAVKVICVAEEELFAGKLCAALQRQHPRDLFDMLLYLRQGEKFNEKFMDVFLVYLISQGKPIHELLNPNMHNVTDLFNNQFSGMSEQEIKLEQLLDIQQNLPGMVVGCLNERHRQFLVAFKQGDPDWTLLPFENARHLPGVLWKQRNLNKMDGSKRKQAIENLQSLFAQKPWQPNQEKTRGETAMTSPDEQKPVEILAEDIVNELAAKKLISSSKLQEIKQKIASGKMKPEDWSLLVDMATERD